MSAVSVALGAASVERRTDAGRRLLLRDVTLSLGAGASLAVMGPSGAGKSTLGRLLAGLEPPTRGSRVVAGTGACAMLLQRPEAALVEAVVFDDVALALSVRGLPVPAVVEGTSAALARAGVPRELWRRDPLELSGGEQRRVALAGVLAVAPGLLVVDEPTAGLDAIARAHVHAALGAVQRAGTSLVVITHDPAEAAALTQHVVVVHEGRVSPPQPTASVVGSAPRARELGVPAVAAANLAERLGVSLDERAAVHPSAAAAALRDRLATVAVAPARADVRPSAAPPTQRDGSAHLPSPPAHAEPRLAIATLGVLLAAAFTATSLAGVAAALVVAAVSALRARVPRSTLRGSLAPLALTIAILAVLQSAVGSAGEVAVFADRVTSAPAALLAKRGMQIACAVLASLALTTSLGAGALGDGLRWWLAPLRLVRVPVNELALMLALALGFAPVLDAAARDIELARRARGIDPARLGLATRLRLRAATLAPLVVGALRSAHHLGETMHVRGFRGDAPRTMWRPHPRTGADTVLLVAAILALVAARLV